MKTLPFENSEKKLPKKTVSTEINEELVLWRQIQLIYTFLQKPDSWYTGLSIKKFLKKQIFSSHKITNSHILSGRWSAYAHFSYLQSFKNLINKFQLEKNAKILIHPLIPENLVEELLKNYQVESLDIDKNTLNWNLSDFEKKLETHYDLVIFFSFNGLIEEVAKAQEILKQKVVPSFLILDNPSSNHQTVEFLDQFSGAVLWNFGDFFWPDFVNSVGNLNNLNSEILENNQTKNSKKVSFQKLQTQKCYFSWFSENRTRSVLENHLGDSHQKNLKIVESVFYLLVQKWQKFNFRNYFGGMFGGLFLATKIKNSTEALEIITSNWPQSLNLAIPDVVLELQELTQNYSKKNNSQIGAQEWQKYFIASIPQRMNGSLEVPSFFLPRQYLSYFIYTTERDFWVNFILNHQKTTFENTFYNFWQIHPIIKKMNLVNTNFISQYILILKV